MKALPHANAKICLHVLASKLRRVFAMLGLSQTITAIGLMRAWVSLMDVTTLSMTQARAKSPVLRRDNWIAWSADDAVVAA